ncbi:methylmalonyl-CoA epimerase [Ruegeria denitrificans]|uniref:Methylmalonyl-CoA epimerase n=1 Tax=Ruegeria denitrificans TaxID=1715692 RepID=A0A0P1ICW4_9RHOB|nr:VOC family protein [Ruegeria denitrificans]CUK05709.1 methylmalonyl-CoA epimerase [Ruegeria denitrificans]
MKMYMKSIAVDDQSKALDFYTSKLGFVVKHDIPLGEHRWLTLVSKEESEGVELGLEPNAHPATRDYQEALKADGIPVSAFSVDDIEAEVAKLEAAGVEFTQPPVKAGGATMAVFDDTCGNLIQLVQLHI